jgi:hypothetical protein
MRGVAHFNKKSVGRILDDDGLAGGTEQEAMELAEASWFADMAIGSNDTLSPSTLASPSYNPSLESLLLPPSTLPHPGILPLADRQY